MSVPRVYLFLDFGKGPRVVARLSSFRTGPEPFSAAATIRDNARAWWLVECESAEAGRAIIAKCEHWRTEYGYYPEPGSVALAETAGRLLASGGAR